MPKQEMIKRKAKILYVDDDSDLIDIYTRFFETSDYIFKAAYDAESGYELAKIFIPDIIISDVAMPGMSGLEFCRKIRSDEEMEELREKLTGKDQELNSLQAQHAELEERYLELKMQDM